jgi:hypothetical protein
VVWDQQIETGRAATADDDRGGALYETALRIAGDYGSMNG